MFIQTIEGRLKSGGFRHQLSRKTMITGPNGSGKTAIANAVRIALLGREPAVGLTNAATFLLAQGDLMSARATFDTGGFIERTFRRNGQSVKGETNTGGEEVDPETLANLPLLDPAAYFDLTAGERINHLFAHFKLPDEMKPAAIIARLQQITFNEEHSELIEEAKAAVIGDCQAALSKGVVNGLEALVKDGGYLKTEFTRWNRQAKDSVGAIRTLAELRLREAECSAETIQEINAQIAAAGERRDECTRRAGAIKAKVEAATRALERKQALERKLKEPLEAGIDSRPALDELQKHPLAPIPMAPTHEAVQTFDDETARLRSEHAILLRSANELREAINQGEANLENIKSLTHCPTCLAKGKGWRAGVIATLNIDIAAKHSQLKPLLEKITQQAAVLTDREKQRADILCQQTARVEAEAAHSDREKAVTKLHAIINQRENLLAALEKQRAQMREDLKGLAVDEKIDPKECNQADADFTAAAKAYSALQARRDAAVRLLQDLQRAAGADREARLAEAYTMVIKKVGETLKAVQLEIVTRAFDSILVTANRLCDGILPGALEFRSGEIGYASQGGPVHYKAMSGSERTMTAIAIATALAANAPVRIAIIDEFANLTENIQSVAFRNLERLVDDGTLDQALVIIPLDADEQGPPREGWTVIETADRQAQQGPRYANSARH